MRHRTPARFLLAQVFWRTGWGRWITFPLRGFRLRLHPANLSWQLWLDPANRDADLDLIRSLLKPGGTMIDVGANIGFTALEAARAVGADGCVHAIEPHPSIHRFLTENLQLNGFAGRVTTHETAVTDAAPPDGMLSFSDDRRDDMNSLLGMDIGPEVPNGMVTNTIIAGGRSGGGEGVASSHSASSPESQASSYRQPASSIQAPASRIRVRATTLDELFHDLPRCDLLKIDVEGAELAVLRGAVGLLKRTRQVLIEAGDPNSLRFGVRSADLLAHLEASGFTVTHADPDRSPVSLAACRTHVGNWLALKKSADDADWTD